MFKRRKKNSYRNLIKNHINKGEVNNNMSLKLGLNKKLKANFNTFIDFMKIVKNILCIIAHHFH